MLLKNFREYIAANHLFHSKDRLLLAVSGGVDSVALCELCRQSGFSFVIAHCNFRLRGEESERDEIFVKQLAEKYGVDCYVKKFDTAAIAAQEKKSIETAARELRYHWFYQLIEQLSTNHSSPVTDQPSLLTNSPSFQPRWYILTAHHADDNIETAVMNFFRGTGIAGVRGMLPKNEKLVRPLLFATRSEIEEFAAAGSLAYVTDSTNLENDYTRNFFRNKILPQVTSVYPEAYRNVLSNIERFTETEMLYRQAISMHRKRLLEKRGHEFYIPVLKLKKTAPLQTVLYEIIRDFGFTPKQVHDAVSLLGSETGRYIQSPAYRIIKNRKWLIISPLMSTEAQHILIEADDDKIVFQHGEIRIKRVLAAEHTIKQSSLLAQLDINDISFPLLLRQWKQGDYFYPLGMKGKKKLSRFFIDQKLSLLQKDNAWVVEMNKKILWAVGMRIDNRFKITPQTQQVLLLEWVKKKDA